MLVMKRLFNFLSLFILACVLAGCAAPPVTTAGTATQDASAPESKDEDCLNGKWEGTLALKSPRTGPLVLRLMFDDPAIRVFAKNSIAGEWTEIMQGHFRGAGFGGNAVIDGTHSGKDEDGKWVETWVLAATCKSENDLLVEFIRMVNNIDLPSSMQRKVFSYGATGVLQRTNGF
jgi:hypothetical protein